MSGFATETISSKSSLKKGNLSVQMLRFFGCFTALPGETPKQKHLQIYFQTHVGYIDEVRISTVARYDVEKKDFMPDGKFKNDAKTVALWHFDEPSGTREFSDASGNAYHLVGIGGAETGIPLAVEAEGKLTTTWGRLKQ